MAQESCNLDKEEAEMMKPSSSSPSPTPLPPSTTTPASAPPPCFLNSSSLKRPERPEDSQGEGEVRPSSVRLGNRCSTCRKRVGLTGFRCRCGDLFCGRHRYSDVHGCSFDYKAMGRDQISKANPVVRAAKIIKI